MLAAATNKPSGVGAFARRALAIVGLATELNETALAQELNRLADLVSAQPGLDWREPLESALGTISERLAGR